MMGVKRGQAGNEQEEQGASSNTALLFSHTPRTLSR